MENKDNQIKEIEKQLRSAFGWYARDVYKAVALKDAKMNTVVFVPAEEYIKNIINLIKQIGNAYEEKEN